MIEVVVIAEEYDSLGERLHAVVDGCEVVLGQRTDPQADGDGRVEQGGPVHLGLAGANVPGLQLHC